MTTKIFETNIISQILLESSRLISYIIIIKKASLILKLSVYVFELIRTKSLKF